MHFFCFGGLPSGPRECRPSPPVGLQNLRSTSDNHDMMTGPFQPGAIVVLTLGNPREKFWGMVLALVPEGVSLRGTELASFEDLVSIVREGGTFSPSVVFFPMHRVERIELDLPDGNIPSLAQRFAAKTQLDASVALLEGIAEATALKEQG